MDERKSPLPYPLVSDPLRLGQIKIRAFFGNSLTGLKTRLL